MMLLRVEIRRIWLHRPIRLILGAGVVIGVLIGSLQIARGVDIDMGTTLSRALQVCGVLMVIVGVVIGAHSFGADASMGALSGQLLYEPRRTRFVVTRMFAALASCAFVSVVSVLLTVAVCAIGAVVGDHSLSFDGRFGDLARVVVGGAVAGSMGYFVAVLTRSTTVAVVGFVSCLIVVEPAFGALVEHGRRWLPVQALVSYAVGTDRALRLEISPLRALAVAAAWNVALGVSAIAQFRSRDE